MRLGALLLAAPLLALPLALVAPPASAINTVVYVSPDGLGTPPAQSPVPLQAVDGQALHLFLDAEGDQTFAFDVWITMTSDTAVLASFTPAPGQVVGHIGSADSRSLRVNGIGTAGMGIPTEIGTLVVDAAGANQLQIEVTGRHRVGSADQLETIQDQVIAELYVPEPGANLMIACGLLGLALLARGRPRGPGPTAASPRAS